MSYRWITATAIIAVGLIVGCVTYFCFHRPMPDAEAHSHDSLMWVRQEFKISGDKLARVEKMHEDYELVCADHCQAIADARNELKRLRVANAPQAEITAAEAKAASIDSLCVTSTQTHIKEVAAVIGGEEGRRYLSIVLPRVASFDHAAPATLDMQKTSTHDDPARK
jgi:hypothetical protein